MPRGEKSPGAGRKKGVPNKMTAEMKAQAMALAVAALDNMGRLSQKAESENTQVAAATLLFNQGFGRPAPSNAASQTIKIERTYRWARNEEEATPDPSRTRKPRAKK